MKQNRTNVFFAGTRFLRSALRIFPLAVLIIILVHITGSGIGSGLADKAHIEENYLQGMRYRFIGPLVGGRVSGVTGIPGNPHVYYTGAVHGGVWKTTDGGMTWFSIWNKPISSIGAVAVSETDPNIIYVGTGEACIRTDGSHGNGVYKSTDAGETWEHIGLKETRYIGRVVIDPRNPDVVFIAALGQAWGLEGNEERGIFRSVDGGKTWTKALYVDRLTGGADISIDPSNPDTIFASTWQMYRAPWTLSSGGPGSGLYRSKDGGDTWQRLTEGLPEGDMGKIGVAVSPADSKRVYAVIEASEEERGMYRSDDGGDTWKHVSSEHNLIQRPWYYMHVTADPKNVDRVYVMSILLLKSEDGGVNWSVMPQYHPDNHSLWIDPENPERMINGNDGGANVTVNGGKTWTKSDGVLPLGPYYHISTDDCFPYRVYGTVQDHRTIATNSFGNSGHITECDTEIVGGCQGGHVAVNPGDPNIVYSSCTDGWLHRYDRRTGLVNRIDPWPESNLGLGANEAKYRFHWTSPIMTSHHDDDVLYYGANVLFKTENDGHSWSVISPDLTRDDESKQLPAGGELTKESIGIEYYCLIFALSESPLDKKILWTGSDDGLVHVTRNGGKKWENVTPEELPEWSRISIIDASPHEKGAAYMAVDRHQLNDYGPYIYKTDDFGETWTLITEGIPEDTFVRVVREDPVRRGLLYAGTETGMYVSLDDGASWQSLQLNLPYSPVHDLVVKDNDIVVGTHGRGAWILTDVSPLRQWSQEAQSASFHLFTPSLTYRVRTDRPYSEMTPLRGENPPMGAIIYYNLGSEPESEVKLSFLDSQGKTIRTFSSGDESGPPAEPGLNRFVWDLRYPGPRTVKDAYIYGSLVGPTALPGKYQVEMTVDGRTQIEEFALEPDPRVKATKKDLRAQFELHRDISETLSLLADGTNRIRDIRKQLLSLKDQAKKAGEADTVIELADKINEKITGIEEVITQRHAKTFGDTFHYGLRLDGKLGSLMDVVGDGMAGLFEGGPGAPTQQSHEVHELLRNQLVSQLQILNETITEDIPELNGLAKKLNLPAVDAGGTLNLSLK